MWNRKQIFKVALVATLAAAPMTLGNIPSSHHNRAVRTPAGAAAQPRPLTHQEAKDLFGLKAEVRGHEVRVLSDKKVESSCLDKFDLSLQMGSTGSLEVSMTDKGGGVDCLKQANLKKEASSKVEGLYARFKRSYVRNAVGPEDIKIVFVGPELATASAISEGWDDAPTKKSYELTVLAKLDGNKAQTEKHEKELRERLKNYDCRNCTDSSVKLSVDEGLRLADDLSKIASHFEVQPKKKQILDAALARAENALRKDGSDLDRERIKSELDEVEKNLTLNVLTDAKDMESLKKRLASVRQKLVVDSQISELRKEIEYSDSAASLDDLMERVENWEKSDDVKTLLAGDKRSASDRAAPLKRDILLKKVHSSDNPQGELKTAEAKLNEMLRSKDLNRETKRSINENFMQVKEVRAQNDAREYAQALSWSLPPGMSQQQLSMLAVSAPANQELMRALQIQANRECGANSLVLNQRTLATANSTNCMRSRAQLQQAQARMVDTFVREVREQQAAIYPQMNGGQMSAGMIANSAPWSAFGANGIYNNPQQHQNFPGMVPSPAGGVMGAPQTSGWQQPGPWNQPSMQPNMQPNMQPGVQPMFNPQAHPQSLTPAAQQLGR